MADRILVHRLAVFARHGVLPEEERLGQRFYISLDCRLDLSEAGRSDDVAATVSYADLAEIALDIATNRRFALIEVRSGRSFVQRADSVGLRYTLSQRIEGFNVSNGKAFAMAVFRTAAP